MFCIRDIVPIFQSPFLHLPLCPHAARFAIHAHYARAYTLKSIWALRTCKYSFLRKIITLIF